MGDTEEMIIPELRDTEPRVLGPTLPLRDHLTARQSSSIETFCFVFLTVGWTTMTACRDGVPVHICRWFLERGKL